MRTTAPGTGSLRTERVRPTLNDGFQLLVTQLIDGYNFGQLLRVFHLVLHEVGDAAVVHLSQDS